MITSETFALSGEVFITNDIIYPSNNRELYEIAVTERYPMYSSLRFQYDNIVYSYGDGEIMSSEEFGYHCTNYPMGQALGVAIYGKREKEQK